MMVIFVITFVLSLIINVFLYFKLMQHDGKMIVESAQDGKTIFSLELSTDPYELPEKTRVVFEVVQASQDEPFAG